MTQMIDPHAVLRLYYERQVCHREVTAQQYQYVFRYLTESLDAADKEW